MAEEKCDQCSEVNPGYMVECEHCDRWLCLKCADLDEPSYTFLKNKTSVHWYCLACTKQAVSAVKTDNLIETKCKEYCEGFKKELRAEMKAKWDEFSQKLGNTKAALEREDNALKQSVVDLKAEMDRKFGDVATEAASVSVKEMQEREWRRNNIVIFKMQESPNLDPNARKEEDMAHVNNICTILDITTQIRNAVRLGKKEPGKVRPLKVTLGTSLDVTNIIKVARKLEEVTAREHLKYKDIIIKNDQTPMERDERRRLVALRDRKREESRLNGDGKVWIIKGNRVVPSNLQQLE
jgi:hypothetical protein